MKPWRPTVHASDRQGTSHEEAKAPINDTTKDTAKDGDDPASSATSEDTPKASHSKPDLAATSTTAELNERPCLTKGSTAADAIDVTDDSSDDEDRDGGAGGMVSSKDTAARGCAGEIIVKSDPSVAVGALQLEGMTEPEPSSNVKVENDKDTEAETK